MMPKVVLSMVCCLMFMGASPAVAYQFTFQPRISFGVEYSDNLFLDPDDLGEIDEDPALEPESDFIYLTTPGFTAEITGRHSGLSLSYDFGYSKYDDFSENDSWRHNLDFLTWSEFSRNVRLELGNSFLYTEDPLGGRGFEITEPPDSDTPTDPSAIGSREPYWVNTAHLRLDHEFGQQRSYFLAFSNTYREDDNLEGNNIIANTPSAGLSYWFGSNWGTEIEGFYFWGDYENAPDIKASSSRLRVIRRVSQQFQLYLQSRQLIVEQSGDLEEFPSTTRRTLEDWSIYDLQAGTIYTHSNGLTLELRAGGVYYDPEIIDEEIEWAGGLDLTKTFRHGDARIYAERGYTQSILATRSDLGLALFTETGLSWNYALTQYLNLNTFFSFRQNEYGIDQRDLLAEEPEEADERTDEIYGAGAGITYEPRPWISFALGYAYRKQESTEASDTYDENRATITITFRTPER